MAVSRNQFLLSMLCNNFIAFDRCVPTMYMYMWNTGVGSYRSKAADLKPATQLSDGLSLEGRRKAESLLTSKSPERAMTIRKISSIEGLTEVEQDKIAAILVSSFWWRHKDASPNYMWGWTIVLLYDNIYRGGRFWNLLGQNERKRRMGEGGREGHLL